MLGKEITYLDLDENEVTETFWFHLTRAELAKLALGKEGAEGGFDAWIRRLMASQNGEEIVANFERILLATVGERSADNKSFIKTDAIREHFKGSDAYSVLFMEVITDMEKMSAFINQVVPKELRDETSARTKAVLEAPDISSALAASSAPVTTPSTTPTTPTAVPSASEPKDDRPDWLKEGRIPTESELKGAKPEYILEAFRLRSQNTGPVAQEQTSS